VNLLEVFSIEETIEGPPETRIWRPGAMACPPAWKMRVERTITAP